MKGLMQSIRKSCSTAWNTAKKSALEEYSTRSKNQHTVSSWMWKMALTSSTLTSLHARKICLEPTDISPLRKSSKSSRKNLRHTCLMISIGSLISDFFSVHLSRKTVFKPLFWRLFFCMKNTHISYEKLSKITKKRKENQYAKK